MLLSMSKLHSFEQQARRPLERVQIGASRLECEILRGFAGVVVSCLARILQGTPKAGLCARCLNVAGVKCPPVD